MDPANFRFDLSYYMPNLAAEMEAAPSFQKLCSFYQENIQTLLSDKSWQPILYNKTITQLFLDKIGKLYPSQHPMKEVASGFEWNSSTFASMEIAHFLESVLDSPLLTDHSKKIIQNWLADEKKYLFLAVLMDGWRILDPKVLQGVKEGNMIGVSPEGIEDRIPSKELDIAAAHLSQEIKELQPGQSLKLLGGSFLHEVRIVLVKEPATFKIYSFDPAKEGYEMINDVPHQVIEEPSSIRQLLLSKLTGNTLNVLKACGGKFQEIIDDKSKKTQIRNSCPIHAVMKEFKAYFLASSDYSQYMLIKGLMAENALKTEKEHIDPSLFKALEIKEALRARVFQWVESLKNPETLAKTIDFYKQAFAIVEPDFVMPETIDLETIVHLDRTLNSKVAKKFLLKEERRLLHELASQADAPLPIGMLLQKNAKSRIIKEAIGDALAIDFTKILNPDDFIEVYKLEIIKEPDNLLLFWPTTLGLFDKLTSTHILKKLHADGLLSDEAYEELLVKGDKIAPDFVRRERNSFHSALAFIESDEEFFNMLQRGISKGILFPHDAGIYLKNRLNRSVDPDIFLPSITKLLKQNIMNSERYQELIMKLLDQKKIKVERAKELIQAHVEPANFNRECSFLFDRDIDQTIKTLMAKMDMYPKYDLLKHICHFAPEKLELFFSEYAQNEPSSLYLSHFVDDLFKFKINKDMIQSAFETFIMEGGQEAFINYVLNYCTASYALTTDYVSIIEALYKDQLLPKATLQELQSKYASIGRLELSTRYNQILNPK